ncbi:MAG TPA: hypothetical protein VF405_03705 [Gammaproteobacteria bacterium]
MAERNPYAPSQASLKAGPSRTTGQVSAWRDARVMVMIPNAAIPDRCVKCNAPADEPTKERTLYWHSPWLYLLLLLNILIFAIVALIMRKKAVVSAGLCSDHKKRRRNVLTAAWIGVLGGGFLLFEGIASPSASALMPLAGVVFIVGSIIVGMAMGRVVYPVRIDNDYVRVKGCGEPFLETLPEFPY